VQTTTNATRLAKGGHKTSRVGKGDPARIEGRGEGEKQGRGQHW